MKPGLSTRLISFALRKSGIYRRLYSGGALFEKNLAKNRAAPLPEPTEKMRKGLSVQASEFRGRPVWAIAPKYREPTAYVLYWHGGGYVYPASDAHFAFYAHMAAEHGWHITAPMYPLAPEQRAAEVTSWANAYYRVYTEARAGKPFILAGDSAGGGLAAAVAMAARDGGLAMPAGLILVCPWLNADPAHTDQVIIEPRDAILTLQGIREAGLLYADALAISDPLVSPIHGRWDGLPPILAFGGGDDILVTDARALKAKLPSVDYIEREGMIHDWPLFVFRELREAQAKMATFVTALP